MEPTDTQRRKRLETVRRCIEIARREALAASVDETDEDLVAFYRYLTDELEAAGSSVAVLLQRDQRVIPVLRPITTRPVVPAGGEVA